MADPIKPIQKANHETVWIKSMGKIFRLTAIAANDDAANEYMRKHPDEAVIACIGNYSLIANIYRAEQETISAVE